MAYFNEYLLGRILMGVHSAPRESLRFGDISVHGLRRVDNLLKVHS
jgi:hypothetical protein